VSEIDNLPQGWEQSKIGEVCEPSQYGYTAKAGAHGNYHYLRTTDITKKELNWENVPFCEISDEDAKKYLLKDNDVVISRAGSIGYSYLISKAEKSVFASYLIRFRPLLNPKYFRYFLDSQQYWNAISEGSSGIAVQNVNAKTLSLIDLPIAPEKEQSRIVEKLDETFSELDSGVKELESAKIKLTQYRQSLLKSAVEGSLTQKWREVNSGSIKETGAQLLERILTERRERWEQQKLAEFKAKEKKPPKNWQAKYPEPTSPEVEGLPELPDGWVWASLDMIINNVEAGKSFKCLERPPESGEYGVVKVSAVTWGEYDEQESKTCTRSDLENDNILIEEDDFLFSRANTTELVGACVIAKHVTKKVMLSDKILRLQFVEDKLKFWLLQFMRGELGRTQIEHAATGNQASMKNVAQGKLLKFAVPLPPLSEVEEVQSNLTSAFQYITNSTSEADITLKFLNAQRKNILKSAFSGQLVPQDPADEPASTLLEKIKIEREELARIAKPKRTKKVQTMKKITRDNVAKWVSEYKESSFTFEELQKSFQGDYDQLKDCIFDILSEDKPVIIQVFDQEIDSIKFVKEGK
jgi:type I restriction enzyme, S subunit